VSWRSPQPLMRSAIHVEESMKSVFFYGLFMDQDLLEAKGLNPINTKLAHVAGYGLRIGNRATLDISNDEIVFGVISDLKSDELELLYSEKSVADYVPTQLEAIDMDGTSLNVVSYILPIEKVSGSNSEYAKSLAVTARKLGLPGAYINEIETWIETHA
jgi:hypothetical protein